MEQHVSAESAADSLLRQAQAEANSRRNASARHISPLHRFDELESLEPWQRYAVVQQAISLANREPSVIALCGAWLTLIVTLAFASPAWFHGYVMWATQLFFVVSFLTYQRTRIRHHIQQLLGPHAEGKVE